MKFGRRAHAGGDRDRCLSALSGVYADSEWNPFVVWKQKIISVGLGDINHISSQTTIYNLKNVCVPEEFIFAFHRQFD